MTNFQAFNKFPEKICSKIKVETVNLPKKQLTSLTDGRMCQILSEQLIIQQKVCPLTPFL